MTALTTAAPTFAKPVPPIAIALTFDDLPAHGPLPPGETRLSVAKAVLATLKAHHVREAFGFVAGSFGGADIDAPDVLAAWRRAGFPLGNHSWSHSHLDATDPEVYTADIVRNEALIVPMMNGADWHWFRYPYLAEASDPARHAKVRAFLATRGYRVASVTLNFDDWAYNEPYARCVARGDRTAIAALETRWLAAAARSLDTSRAAMPATPLVALLHVGAFTAHMLPRLLTLYEHQGAKFVGLAAAERNRAYDGDARQVRTGQHIPPPEAGDDRTATPSLGEICR